LLQFSSISGGGINIDGIVVNTHEYIGPLWVKIYLFIEFIIIKYKKGLNI
jgi:hypothetical protein